MGSLASPEAARRRVSELVPSRICLGGPPTHLPQDDHRLGRATLLRPPFASLVPSGSVAPPRWRDFLSSPDLGWARLRWYWNINQSSIAYASRPRLRARLTLGGWTFPRNPWAFGGGVPPPSFATHAGILTSDASTAGFPRRFTRVGTLPYRSLDLDVHGLPCTPSHMRNPAASVLCLSPATLSARNHLTSELLRTLSRVAASKPTSWLSGQLHILSHLAQTSGP